MKTKRKHHEHWQIDSMTHRFWNITIGSASKSAILIFLPYSMTFGCFRDINQPIWLKKKPRFALWGSASVSEYLWCWRWSRTHTYKQFYRNNGNNNNKKNHDINWMFIYIYICGAFTNNALTACLTVKYYSQLEMVYYLSGKCMQPQQEKS